MGFGSWWHWVMLIVFVIPPILVGYFGIRKENTSKRTNRSNFLMWILIPYAVFFMAALTQGLVEPFVSGAAFIILVLVNIGYQFPLMQQYVRRGRDAGLDKNISYISLVPIVGLISTVILLFKGPVHD